MSANGVGGPAPNIFGITAYDGASQFFGGAVPEYVLPQSAGWGIIIGFAFFFFFVAYFLVWVDKKFAGAKYNNEQFNTAGRTIGAGLIAVDVVSHWTWASIILSTGTYTWFYGAGSSMWFGTGSGTLTVWLFCVVAIELKHRAPKAHTFLEIIKLRWGKAAHMIFMGFAFFTNFFVCLGMMQAAVVVINAMTGVNIYASSFLIPLGVAAYSITGGLKATFTTSYLHTIVIYVVALVFLFYIFVNKSHGLGSMDEIYDRLIALGEAYPISGNKAGSYLTGWSDGSLQINLIYLITAFSVLFVDQAYWQSAVAASPEGAVNGYAIGSYLYLGIVFMLPMGIGLGGLVLDLPLSIDEVYNSLVYPAASYALLGKTGVVLILVVVFMAITSGGAGEMLAVSSLFTFDVWREYLRPKATGSELVMVSRSMIFVWAIIMGGSLSIFNAAHVNVYWLGIWPGVVVSGCVLPVVYLVSWNRCTGLAAAWGGAIGGNICGLIAWLVYAKVKYDAVNIFSTEQNMPLLTGACVSLGMGGLIPVVITYATTKKDAPLFDWKVFDNITFTDDESTGIEEEDRAFIARYRIPIWIGAILVLIICEVAWPLLVLPAGVWSRNYFKFWVILSFIISISSSLIAILLPAWEGRDLVYDVLNFWIRRKQPSAETMARHHNIPDGRPPINGTSVKENGKSDPEKAVPLAGPVEGDDTAHGGKIMAKAVNA